MDRLTLEVIVLLTCVTASVLGDSVGCDTSLPDTSLVTRRGDTCYQFVAEESSWRLARSYCYRHGGKLVKLDDPATNQFVVDALNSLPWQNKGVWIGLHDQNSELDWQWDAGQGASDEPMSWSNWGRGHPGAFLHRFRDCARMVRGSDWEWHETPCNLLKWRYRFICQYDAEPTTTRAPPTAFGIAGHNNRLPPSRDLDEDLKLSSENKLDVDSTVPRITTDQDGLDAGFWPRVGDDETMPPLAVQQVGQQPEKATTAGWMLGMGAIIIILIIALILVVFLRRRRHRKGSYSDTYSIPSSSETPIYKEQKGGWLHEGHIRHPNEYVLDWNPAVSCAPDHFYEECKAAGARHACVIYANDDAKGKVSALSENDNLENDDVEKEGLLKKSVDEVKPCATNAYMPMTGSLSSLDSADGGNKSLGRSPVNDDGYQLHKPAGAQLEEEGYQVPKSVPKVQYDVPKALKDDSNIDAEGQHIYECIDEVKGQIEI